MKHAHPHAHGHAGHEHVHAGPGHVGHDHDGHGHAHGPHAHLLADAASERRLWTALGLLAVFTLIEAVGGWWANSIALLAESAHMLADCASLLLAVLAIRVGRRPARADRTYGHRRYQPLAAYTNGLVLLAISGVVIVEAVRRLLAPPPVAGGLMLWVALLGALANFAAFLVLSGGRSLNERGARAHVLSDLLGSAAAAAAAGLILFAGWLVADPLLSLFVSALVLRSGWQITRESSHVLLEGAPAGFDVSALQRELRDLPGIADVHHVHAWSLTGEVPIVTLHADLAAGIDRQQILTVVMQRLRERFGVVHATVQLEEGVCIDADEPGSCHGHP